MHDFATAVRTALALITSFDPDLREIVLLSLGVSLSARFFSGPLLKSDAVPCAFVNLGSGSNGELSAALAAWVTATAELFDPLSLGQAGGALSPLGSGLPSSRE
jgi:ABC-type tungstate transport system substrate-binding protein